MRRVHRFLLLKWNIILGSFISLLGCGCRKSAIAAPNTPVICMYGIPVATYHISGHVMTGAARPIEGAHVTIKNNRQDTIAAVISDDTGHYSADYNGFPTDTLRIVAEDLNGVYQPDSVLQATRIPQEAKGFDMGETSYEVDITLKP